MALVYSPFDVGMGDLPQRFVELIVIFHRVDDEAKATHVYDRVLAQLEGRHSVPLGEHCFPTCSAFISEESGIARNWGQIDL